MQDSPFQVKRPFWLKIIVWIGVAVLIYVGISYLIPHAHSYDVKTALKMGCVEYIREAKSSAYVESEARWPGNFRAALTTLGLELSEDQYSFELVHEPNVIVCTGKAAFISYTSWPGMYYATGKDYKFKTVHRPVAVYKWKRSF